MISFLESQMDKHYIVSSVGLRPCLLDPSTKLASLLSCSGFSQGRPCCWLSEESGLCFLVHWREYRKLSSEKSIQIKTNYQVESSQKIDWLNHQDIGLTIKLQWGGSHDGLGLWFPSWLGTLSVHKRGLGLTFFSFPSWAINIEELDSKFAHSPFVPFQRS